MIILRKINIENLKTNMIVARPILDSDGRALLLNGVTLNHTYIKRLKELNIPAVYIKDTFSDDIEIPEIISEQSKLEAIKIVKQSFINLENDLKINTQLVKSVVNKLIDNIFENLSVLQHVSDIWSFNDHVFGHSINVCTLSLMSGIIMGYDDAKLRELGVGALLHDIGKTSLNKELLSKSASLSQQEHIEMQKHSEYGFNILRKYDEISLLSAHIAYQHHEFWDGQGYPRKLAGYDIHEYARIVAAVNVYDSLISGGSHQSPYSANQAISVLKRMAGMQLDPVCVNALIANIAVYPIASIIKLNTGEIALVIDVNREAPSRPKIRIVFDKYGNKLDNPHEVDLSKLSSILISQTLNESELVKILETR